MFLYCDLVDAVGTLFQEAAVQGVDFERLDNPEQAQVFFDVANAIKRAWPDLVRQSLTKDDSKYIAILNENARLRATLTMISHCDQALDPKYAQDTAARLAKEALQA